jgi:signal transduction histidine kinase
VRPNSIRRQLTRATASLVIATAALTLGLVYWGTRVVLERRSDASVSRELETLTRHHSAQGSRSLADEIDRRVRDPQHGEYVYVYTESRFQQIAGNSPRWPEGIEGEAGQRRISMEITQGTTRILRRVEIGTRSLPDGRHLLVGRDVTEDEDFVRTLSLVMAGGLVLAGGLAIAGGLSMSRRLLGRVEGMSRTVLEILGGEPERRVPHDESGDEFDELAKHFNALLDENKRLIERMREVTDDVAHDLRTPLARMRTRIESSLAAGVTDPGANETLRELTGDLDRILETFNALLRIAKIESHSIREEMETVSLDGIVRDTMDLYRPVLEEAGIHLVERLGEVVVVQGNRHLLSQALSNLIDNSIKYMGASGEIEVAASRRDGRPELSLCDRGPGIPADERARVLERFVRLDESRGQPGSGLGLSFVAAVAEHHAAELELSDAQPGLCVRLVFPATALEPA